jgi:hypothetical protein
MSITLSNTSSQSVTLDDYNGSDFFKSVSFNVPSGSEVLTVRFGGSSSAASSVTYDGDALTQLLYRSDGGTRASQFWERKNPSSGTNNLIIENSGSRTYQVIITSLSGVNTAVTGDSEASNIYASSISSTLTTIADDLVLDVVVSGQTATAGAGQTTQALNAGNTSASSKTATTTSTTMSWTQSVADRFALCAVVYRASVTASVIPQIMHHRRQM